MYIMSHWPVLFPVYWQLLSSQVLKANRTQSLLNYATRYGTVINSLANNSSLMNSKKTTLASKSKLN